jgi:hypothetical protein
MRTVISGLLLGCVACGDTTVVVGGLQEVSSMKALPNRDLDLLFMIDNSPSMLDSQLALAESFPRMVDILGQVDGGLPNLHIGVITSDMGTSGSTTSIPAPSLGSPGNGGCAGFGDDGQLQFTAAMTDRFLSDIKNDDGSRTRNYTGELRDVFRDLALVGAGGCGFEQHLAAMRRGLFNPLNADFLRPSANLAVVFLADEDDCSVSDPALFGPDSEVLGALQSYRCFKFGVTCAPDDDQEGTRTDCVPRSNSPYIDDIQPFADVLLAEKQDPRRIMVGAIVGPAEPVAVERRAPPGGGTFIPALAPSCSYSNAFGLSIADPAIRLTAFLGEFPDRASLTSICSDSLGAPLVDLGQTAKRLVGDPCLDTTVLADTSAADPGVQPACEVIDIRDAFPDRPMPLGACSSAGGDCFEILADAAACPATDDHLRVRVHRGGTVDDDLWTHVRCQVAR